MHVAVAAAHIEARSTVQWLVQASSCDVSLLSLPMTELAARSGAWDCGSLAKTHGLAFHRTADINDAQTEAFLQGLELDALIVLGWSQILRDRVLACAPWVIGAHASPLPRGRGGSPVNWAIINHETQWGNTLMRLSATLDGGDMIGQSTFPIGKRDTVADVYANVESSNLSLVQGWIAAVQANQVACTPQAPSPEPLYPRRTPDDGCIHWDQPALDIDALIRAVTHPYPGAWTTRGNRRFTVWAAELSVHPVPPGGLGEVVEIDAKGNPLVRCGEDCLVLTSVTSDQGQPIGQGDQLG